MDAAVVGVETRPLKPKSLEAETNGQSTIKSGRLVKIVLDEGHDMFVVDAEWQLPSLQAALLSSLLKATKWERAVLVSGVQIRDGRVTTRDAEYVIEGPTIEIYVKGASPFYYKQPV